jgi:PIN domain nuclease of toxin-antitoxin system
MKLGCRVLALIFVSAVGVRLVEGQTRQTALSPEPLTREQISIYHLVIVDYLKGSSEKLNIASTTETADQAGLSFDYHCMKDAQIKERSRLVVHRLDPLLADNPQLVLVESDSQQEQIEKNDAQCLVRKAIEGHRDVSDDELKQSVRRAFEVGLFSLSEIIFDKRHLNAVVAYSFVCGGLCGNGNTVMLKKTGQKWKIYKRCGGWVS